LVFAEEWRDHRFIRKFVGGAWSTQKIASLLLKEKAFISILFAIVNTKDGKM